jgi:hypothetical protein
MRWNRLLTLGAAVSALALMAASAYAQSAAPAKPGVAADLSCTRAAIINKQYKAAATDLRKAAALVSAEADRASDDNRTKLTRDAAALQVLASEVEAGQVKDVKAFDAQLVRTRADLAGHHYVESAEAWAKKDTVAAGRSLAAAARYVKDALSSAGQETEIDAARGLKAAESFGEKLANKTTTGTDQAWTAATDAVRRGMDTLGKVVGGG